MVLASSQLFPSLRRMLADVRSDRELKLRLQWLDGGGGGGGAGRLDLAVHRQPKGSTA